MSRAERPYPSGRSCLLAVFLAALPGATRAQVELLSRAVSAPDTAGGKSTFPTGAYSLPCCAVSTEGRYVVFLSNAGDLVTGQIDANDGDDVFLRDVTSGTTVLASRASTSPLRAGNGASTGATLSADGRFVVFQSLATDLAAAVSDTNSAPDVFLFDRDTGVVSLVSHRAAGADLAGSGASESPVISADGNYVAFASRAADLAAGQTDAGNQSDVFLFERSTGNITLVSHAASSSTTAGNGSSGSPALSGDGAFVAFVSGATDLLAGQTGSGVFVFDRTTGQNMLASHRTGAPTEGVGAALRWLSQDGRYLAFATTQSLSGTGTDGPTLYRFDRLTDSTDRIAGTSQGYGLGPAMMSADGRWTAYGEGDIWLFDGMSGASTLVTHVAGSATPAGQNGAVSFAPAISGDGRYVAYRSTAPSLATGQVDGPYGEDVFLYDRLSDINTLVSHVAGFTLSASGRDVSTSAGASLLSADGRRVVFTSVSPALVSGDTNHQQDVFAWDWVSSTSLAVSGRAPAMLSASANRPARPAIRPGFPAATRASVSADGRVALVASRATNLVARQPEDWLGQLSAPPKDDLFLRDRSAGFTSMVCHAVGQPVQKANQPCTEAVVSADGRFVAFTSDATDLVAGLTWVGRPNVFIHDRATDATILVSRSVNAASSSADRGSTTPAISRDGRYVAFASEARDLVAGQVDVNDAADLFLFDRLTGTSTLVNHRAGLASTSGSSGAGEFALSGDGRAVAFISSSTDLVAGQTGPALFSAFLFELGTGQVRLVSHAAAAPAQSADADAHDVSISAEGAFVTYLSDASDVVPGVNGEGKTTLYLYGAASGANALVSNDTVAGSAEKSAGLLSADGQVVAYESASFLEVPGLIDANALPDVFRLDRTTGARTLVSHVPSSLVTSGFGRSRLAGMSADGRLIVFESTATNLVPGQTGTGTNVFLHDATTGANMLITRSADRVGVGGGDAALSADGSTVVFSSGSSTLVPQDWNGWPDAFAYVVSPSADLAVAKTGPAATSPGQSLTFSLGVTNAGPWPAEGVVLADPAPPGLALQDVTGDCTAFPCALGALIPGESRSATARYAVPADYSSPSPIVNAATASSATPDANLSNNTAVAQVTLPSAFYTVPPCRLADTRGPNSAFGGPALAAGASRAFTATGSCGIPPGAKSVAFNLTVVAPTGAGYVRLAPVGSVTPQTSTLNFGPGQTRANSAVVPLGATGQIAAALGMAAGQAHLILDVVGYFK